MRLFTFIFLISIYYSNIVFAQPPCGGPGRTAQTGVAVCGTLTFNQVAVTSCTGPDLPLNGCVTPLTTSNSIWYKFHCYQSGTLGFILTPNAPADDYDWQIMDYTGRPPDDVYVTNLGISLNLSGNPGPTGCTPAGTVNTNCAGNFPQYNRMPNLIAGHDYLLMVNNYTNSQSGYKLNFAGGTAVLTDNMPPVINTVSTVGCNTSLLRVVFSEDIKCSSVTPNGSEFSFNPPGPVITAINSGCVSSVGTITELTIQLQNPLGAGNYDLIVNLGTDANTFTDVCDDDMVTGFSIPFFVVTSSPPLIQSFVYDNCKRDKLVVNFDRPVDCASLAADGSDFIFTPIGPNITAVTSNCGANTYTTQVTLLLQGPMPPGQFTNLMIVNGTDGNTLSDTCFSFITPLYTAAFQAPASPPRPVVDSLQYDKCNPSSVKVFYSRPILCSTISPDGSQFRFVPTTGPVSAVSAMGDPATCSQGYTNWILVQFSAPINTGGSYLIFQVSGSDAKTITDTCNSTLLFPGFSLNVIKPAAAFNSQVNWGCKMDTIVLSHPGGSGANSWIWNFSDGTSASGQNVSHTFPVSTPTVSVQLIVSNGTCVDSLTQNFTLGNSFKAGFTNNPLDSFCINTPVTFTDTSAGSLSNYLWDFGDLTQFNGQSPPAHSYLVSNDYTVKLIVTDIYGCSDTASKSIHVAPPASIDFTGLKPQYCTGNQVLLTRKISRNMATYVWDNGNGETFTDKVNVNFSYPVEGSYTITISGTDRYCGTASVSKTVPVFAVPEINLGPDTVLCRDDRLFIGVPPVNNHTYLWSTGATTSQIYTDTYSSNYTLTADNNGCKGIDAMHIKVLPVCLIKVPNAFTPNRDGLNDELKALNADLAKNFSFKVFNRVGQLVFSTNNPLAGWNGIFKGNPASMGTYVWMLSYIDPWNGNAVRQKGTSILLR